LQWLGRCCFWSISYSLLWSLSTPHSSCTSSYLQVLSLSSLLEPVPLSTSSYPTHLKCKWKQTHHSSTLIVAPIALLIATTVPIASPIIPHPRFHLRSLHRILRRITLRLPILSWISVCFAHRLWFVGLLLTTSWFPTVSWSPPSQLFSEPLKVIIQWAFDSSFVPLLRWFTIAWYIQPFFFLIPIAISISLVILSREFFLFLFFVVPLQIFSLSISWRFNYSSIRSLSASYLFIFSASIFFYSYSFLYLSSSNRACFMFSSYSLYLRSSAYFSSNFLSSSCSQSFFYSWICLFSSSSLNFSRNSNSYYRFS